MRWSSKARSCASRRQLIQTKADTKTTAAAMNSIRTLRGGRNFGWRILTSPHDRGSIIAESAAVVIDGLPLTFVTEKPPGA
jgi:hypothetical protein